MKKNAMFFRLLAVLLIISLGVFSCEKEDVIKQPPITNDMIYEVPELPADFAAHFTAAELASFREGPQPAMLGTAAHQQWIPLMIIAEETVYSMPVVSGCEDYAQPVLYDPRINTADEITGFYLYSEGEGNWLGRGPVSGGISGLMCQEGYLTGEVFNFFLTDGSLTGRGDYVTMIGNEISPAGQPISTWEVIFREGTGRFAEAAGYTLMRVYNTVPADPASLTPSKNTYYALGWINVNDLQ
jgi:hypothetical protein